MADLPLSSGRMPTAAPSSTESTVPPWLAARRARVAEMPEKVGNSELEVEFESLPDETESAAVPNKPSDPDKTVERSVEKPVESPEPFPELNFTKPATPPAPPPPLVFTPPPPSAKPVAVAVTVAEHELPPEDNSLKGLLLRWIRSSAMAGVMASFVLHSVLLCVLALLVLSSPSLRRSLDIFGEMGDAEVAEEMELDAVTPIEAGQDAAPVQFTDVSQMMDLEKAFDPSDSIMGIAGGAGKGNGNGSADGDAIAVPAVKIPGYAVTKGSFSAWTDPRDPVPGVSYEIVIQFRLPPNIKTYRGNDLTGMVTGTDGYKQVIRFRRDESFNVVDGSVQIRIRVPGADRLVKDAIRVESKLLREKQLIEIEF